MTAEDLIAIGQVVGAFGVFGEAKVRVYSDTPDRFLALKRVVLRPAKGPERELAIKHVKVHKGMALVKFAGYNTPEQLQELLRQDLYIPRDQRQELAADEYYVNDLIGLEVVTVEGATLGTVVDVIATGANDVYEINGPLGRQLLPAIGDVVREIDLANKKLQVALLPGLIEEPKPPKPKRPLRAKKLPKTAKKKTPPAEPTA